jgi:hypothetical protein
MVQKDYPSGLGKCSDLNMYEVFGRDNAKIPVPALAVFAIPHASEARIAERSDIAARKAAEAYFTKIDLLSERQAKAFEDGVPGARLFERSAVVGWKIRAQDAAV